MYRSFSALTVLVGQLEEHPPPTTTIFQRLFFYVKLGCLFPLGFFHHVFQKRNFWNEWYVWVRCPSVTQTTVSKHSRRPKALVDLIASSLLRRKRRCSVFLCWLSLTSVVIPKISPVRDWRSTARVAFKHSWPWPWIGSYGIPSCITHWALSTYQISLKSEKLFVDGRTDVPTDGHFRPPLIGRLGVVNLKLNS